MDQNDKVVKSANEVLRKNSQGNFTLPAENLYPHQWLWDSCFIAIGLRHVDVKRAQTELKNLIRGQWSNGMLPHMIFDSAVKYAHDRNIWRSELSLHAPLDVSTSGITQPPMLAEAVLLVGEKLKLAERRSWYRSMLPAIIAYHQWLYNERNPDDNGLTVQIHPYETGLDSTPPWIDQLHRKCYPWWAHIFKNLGFSQIVQLIRRDTRHVPADQRMDNLDALLYYLVIRKIRGKKYDIKSILKHNPYAIQDANFNSILVRANSCLVRIAEVTGTNLPTSLLQNISNTQKALDILWDETAKQYYSKNYYTKKLIRVPSIATLLPLYAGTISTKKAKHLVDMLKNSNFFGAEYPVPSVPLNSKDFNSMRYWQGPTWVNTNWLIIKGLQRYGYNDEANIIRQKTIDLVDKHGCYEYYSAIDGLPAGAPNFSWTASLVLDLILDS